MCSSVGVDCLPTQLFQLGPAQSRHRSVSLFMGSSRPVLHLGCFSCIRDLMNTIRSPQSDIFQAFAYSWMILKVPVLIWKPSQ